MPKNIESAIKFLETQWSSINDNKLKGIRAEVKFRNYLEDNNVHYIPGGWILTPGKNTNTDIPGLAKICLIPIERGFSWQGLFSEHANIVNPAQLSAYNYFRQVGVTTYFVFVDDIDEDEFELPTPSQGSIRARYPRPYKLLFKTMSPNGQFSNIALDVVMDKFPPRDGNRGMRCYSQDRINRSEPPWNNPKAVSGLFWFEYARYYCQINFLISNNDLDLFIIGNSGSAYPVEIKSKSPVVDDNLGDWFGLDIGPFAKMAFFTSNSMNTDALYIVQEVDNDRNHVEWLGVKFTDLVKSCSWVGQAGGQGMMGGASSTIKVPKAIFSSFDSLLTNL